MQFAQLKTTVGKIKTTEHDYAIKKVKVLPESGGPMGGTDLHFCSLQPDLHQPKLQNCKILVN